MATGLCEQELKDLVARAIGRNRDIGCDCDAPREE